MEHFQLLASPEQLSAITRKKKIIPIIPLWFPRADLNRIVPWLRRRELPFALAFDRELAPVAYLTQAFGLTDRLFLFSPEDVETARAAKFAGELFLFSSGAMLSWPQWYRDNAVRPVVSALPNWEAALSINSGQASGLDPLYLATTKRCIAEFGACRSRGGAPQQFVKCDNRCRDKVRDRQSVGVPFSLRPEYVYPSDAAAFVAYDESIAPVDPRPATISEPVLNNAWNYPWPIGRRILTEAHKTGETRYHFNLHDDDKKLYESGLLGFWAYTEGIYDGGWITPLKVTPFKGRLLLTLASSVRKLLMIQLHDAATHDLFKRARHQLYTMPEQALFAPVETTDPEPEQPLVGSRKQVRLTIILDDAERKSFFRIRDIDRVALIYDGRPVGKFFNSYLYIPFAVTEEEARQIAAQTRLRGVIVQDRLMRRMFQTLFANSKREVLLHPMALVRGEDAPSYLAGAEQVFRSCYTSERRKNYQWKAAGMLLANYRSWSFFLKGARIMKEGNLPELWIDIIGSDDESVRALKMRAERFLKEKRSSAV